MRWYNFYGHFMYIDLFWTIYKIFVSILSSRSVNEVETRPQYGLSLFICWWMILYYYPGGETIYVVAVSRIYSLLLVLTKFATPSLVYYLPFVASSFGAVRYCVNMWFTCPFPAAALVLSPPFSSSIETHTFMFKKMLGIPFGFIIFYFLFGRGVVFTWTTLLLFFICTFSDDIMRKTAAAKKTKEEKSSGNNTPSHFDVGKSYIFKDGKMKTVENLPPGIAQQFIIHSSRESQQKRATVEQKTEKPTANEATLRKCGYFMCVNFETEAKSFKRCERCRLPYCSSKCQTDDWELGNHKRFCKENAK